MRTIIIIAFSFASAALANCVAAATVLAAAEPVQMDPEQIWDSSRLLALCFMGATCGTIAKMAWNPIPVSMGDEPKKIARLFACKAIVSMTCGLVVTPMAMRYMQWHPEADLLVATSALIAFVGDVVIIPAVVRIMQAQVQSQEKQLTPSKKSEPKS